MPTANQFITLIEALKEFDFDDCGQYYSDLRKEKPDVVLEKLWPYIQKEAAVLIPLILRKDDIHVLLTRRSLDVRTHKGDVAFPGGSRDPGDKSPADTALRESLEEIGLPPDYVEVKCRLMPQMSRHGYLVYPVIGLLTQQYSFEPLISSEVAHSFTLPLRRFLSDRGHWMVNFDAPENFEDSPKQETKSFNIHFFKDAVGENEVQTWGFTAALCIVASTLTFRRFPPFPVGFFKQFSSPITRASLLVGFRRNLVDSLSWRVNPKDPRNRLDNPKL